MELKKVYGKSNRNITTVQWNLGLKCNFDCSFCSYTTHDLVSPHLTYDIMTNVIDKMKEAYKDRDRIDLIITGGEATLNPNLLNMFEYIKNNNTKIKDICLNTNGSASLKKYLEISKYIDTIVFSWQIEHIRVDHFKKVMLGLKEQGVRFHVNVPLLPGLLQETKENAKWLEDNNIKYIYRKIHPMYTDTDYNMPYQSGVNAKLSKPKGLTKSYYSDEELLFLNSIEKMNHSDNIILETKTGEEIYTNVNMVFTKNLNDFRTWTCNAGIETLYIHNDGNIYRGNCKFGGEIGNINTDFQLPTEPIICGKEKCNCAADLFTTKWS